MTSEAARGQNDPSQREFDAYISMAEEEWRRATHHETLRSGTSTALLFLVAALLTVVNQNGLNKDDLYLLGLISLLSCLGIAGTARHYWLNRFHAVSGLRIIAIALQKDVRALPLDDHAFQEEVAKRLSSRKGRNILTRAILWAGERSAVHQVWAVMFAACLVGSIIAFVYASIKGP